VVSASSDHTLKVWDLASGRELTTLQGHTDWVTACAVAPDGQRVVSASSDQTLKIWDLASGTCLLTHHANAAFWAVTATTTAVIAGDATGTVWFFDVPSQDHRKPPLQDTHRPSTSHTSSRGTEPPLLRPPMKHAILFLAANPIETAQLALDREARAIQGELERSSFRDRFELVTRWAAEPLDLLRELRKLKPTVVHFSGHGSQAAAGPHRPSPSHRPGPVQAAHRDFVGDLEGPGGRRQHGLFFQGADGQPWDRARRLLGARVPEIRRGEARPSRG